MNYTQLVNSIDQNIRRNGREEITGDIMNAILKLITSYFSQYNKGYNGVLTINTVPQDNYGFYLATKGEYPRFNLIVPDNNLAVVWFDNGNWKSDLIELVDINSLNQYIDNKLVEANLGFGGELNSLNQSPTTEGMYIPIIEGTYPNFGNLSYSNNDGFVVFLFKDDQFSKISIPLEITIDNEINLNSSSAASSKAVYQFATKKINTIADLRNTQGNEEGQIITLLGYYQTGDKNPLNYKWSTIQTTDDGGSVINSGNGSWIAQFDGVCDVKDFGAIKDTDCTDIINTAFSKVKNVIISEDYIVNPIGREDGAYTGGVKPVSGNIIEFKNNSKLYINPNSESVYSILNLTKVNNVTIINPYVEGDVANHIGTTGEWGHGITVYGCEDIYIENATANYCWGDGFAIATLIQTDFVHHNKNVRILKGLNTNYNRRNGTSIISCEGLYIDTINSNYNGTIRGVNPKYGVDIEPNPTGHDYIDVVINEINTKYNQEGGFEIVPAYMQNTSYQGEGVFKCTINTVNSYKDGQQSEGRGAIRIVYADNTLSGIVENQKVNGHISIGSVNVIDSVDKAINFSRIADTKLDINISNVNIVNPFTKNGVTNRELNNAIAFITQNTQTTYGKINIDNLFINDYNNNLVVGVYFRAIDNSLNKFKNVSINKYTHIGDWLDVVNTPSYGVVDESVNVKMFPPIVINTNVGIQIDNYCVAEEININVNSSVPVTLPNTNTNISSFNIKSNVASGSIVSLYTRDSTQLFNTQFVKTQTLAIRGGSVLKVKKSENSNNWDIINEAGVYYNLDYPITGNTSQRPALTASAVGFKYYDNTIKKEIIWSGTAWVEPLTQKSSSVPDVTNADATDLATALTLVNELKSKLNAKLNADRNSGQQL